jgi:PAS domain S-box-containing protein/diguanylate cyclase (GGDEF)-like protein
MSNKNSEKKQLNDEVIELRRRVAELEEVDISRKRAEKRGREADKKYRLLFENAIDAIFIIEQESEKILDCNKKAADVSGYSVGELKTMRLTELYPPEEQDIVSKIFGKVAERGTLSGISGISLLRKDGKCVPVEINAATHQIGGEKCICGITRDITLRKKAEDLLRQSEEKTRAMSDTSLDGIMMMDEKGAISYFNKAAEKIFGFRQKEVKGKKLHDVIVSENARKKYYQNLPKFEQSGQCPIIGKTLELYAVRKDGTRFPVEISISSFHLQGKWHSVGSIRDITRRKEMEKKLRESSMTDELTGLFNRRGFLELSSQQYKLANRKKSGLYLLFLEVYNLRAINEKYGYKTGDQILQDTAKLLKSTFRESDIISRIGGNEFSVLLVAPPDPAIEKIINSHIEDNLRAYHKQKDRGYELLLCMGISHYDPDLPCSLDELLTRAGALMNTNKLLKAAASEEAIKEKRQYERFSNGHILKGEFDIAGEVFIKNISLGGICLRTSRLLPPHASYKVYLMDDRIHKQINLTGRVVWSVAVKARREIDLPSFEAGLQFIDVKNSLKKSLKEITSRFKSV